MEKPINKWSVNGNDRLMSHSSLWRPEIIFLYEDCGDQLMKIFFVAFHSRFIAFPWGPWTLKQKFWPEHFNVAILLIMISLIES